MTGRALVPGRRHVKGVLDDIRRRLSEGERGALPVALGLIVLWAVFEILNDNFLSPRNLSNLSVDIVGTGLIAVGIVFVLLIGEIDLSVGSVGGLAAAVFAVLNVNQGLPEWLALVMAVLLGSLIGALHGFFFARFGVPAVVVTLAGLLAWNGLTLYLLGQSGTINLDSQGLVAKLTSYYFNDIAVAYSLAALGPAVFFLAAYRDRRRRKAAAMPYRPLHGIVVRTAAIAVVAFAAAYVLNQFQGLPLALLIFVVLVTALDALLRRTPYGRTVYALGGGVEAARRAGVRVTWVRISVLMVSGTMAALGGLFLASRITSVSQPSGTSILLLNALAAAVIGGTSLFGGHGRTWSALLGILVIQSLSSGMALLSVESALQFMITGGVLLAAVVLDSLARPSQNSRGRT
ncbi:sugar ABC transporter permease [Streptomyces milbemycinicus]|uniref:sugar ABC transporter permease n=1 Tax=Streptomyces milbemycinicus TaxID=476552 RepID=UPI0033E5C0FF